MLGIHGPTWAAAARACFVFSFIFLGTAKEQESLLLHSRHLQGEGRNASSCIGTWDLTATNYSSGSTEIRSALAEAAVCAATGNYTTSGVVSVRWEGNIQAEAPFVVSNGVELRVVGDGWFSSFSNTSNHGDQVDDTLQPDTNLEEAIADAAAADSTASGGQEVQPSVIRNSNVSSSLFVVQSGGSLYLSKMVLLGEWNVSVVGGGAVLCFGGQVTGEDLWFKSLTTGGSGGAIYAYDGSNVTLQGLNLFQDCSSPSGGGALSIEDEASFLVYDNSQVYFENCSATGNGGGMELSDSNMMVSNSSKIRFRNCRAGGNGGGLYMEDSVVSVGETASLQFGSCSAVGNGGGMELADSNMMVSDSKIRFRNCRAGGNGGGSYMEDSVVSVGETASWQFESCSAVGNGGGMELSSSSVIVVRESETVFLNCSTGVQGGGVYMEDSAVDIGEAASWKFEENAAGSASDSRGGGVYSSYSSISVQAGAAMTFSNNSAPSDDGGGLYGKRTIITVAGEETALLFTDNASGDSGGGLALDWPEDDDDDLEIDDERECFALAEGATAKFLRNDAVDYGGGAWFYRCKASISGNMSFQDNSAERAGGLYFDEAEATIGGHASFVGNSADRWGGAVYVLDSRYSEGNGLRLTGGVDCSGNAAGRSGGCIFVENGDITITGDHQEGGGWGASFVGNTAGYDGGVIAVDGGGLWLQGGYASSNSAVERGGVLFGIGESEVVWDAGVSWNCTAAAGGSLYMSGSTADITDLWLEGDHTPSGANIFLAGADVRAVNVTLVAPTELEATYGLRVDSGSTFVAFACSFDEWGGDSPVVVSSGGLTMDACDFSSTTAPSLVLASRPVTIRNAVLGDDNYGSEGFNGSSFLGVGVHTCDSIPADLSCSVPEDCRDAKNGMGILCPSFVEEATGEVFSLAAVDDASSDMVELTATTSAGGGTSSTSDAQVVYHPDVVTHELRLRHTSVSGTDDHLDTSDGVLWELRRVDGVSGDAEGGQSPDENGEFLGVSADNFTWMALPYTGFLVSGQEVAIQLVGIPPSPRNPSAPFAVYNGEVSAEFQVVWWVAEPNSTLATSAVSIESTFFYCREGFYWDGVECISCAEKMATMPGGEGSLDCSVPGITLNTLPLAKGYWRADVTRTNVYECLNPSACTGGRGVDIAPSSSSTSASGSAAAAAASIEYDESRYCVKGHQGAYCSVCADDYRRLSGGHLCISCATGWSSGIRAMLWALGVVIFLLLIVLVVFLVGGVSAVSQLKKKTVGYCSCCHRTKDATADFDGSASASIDSPRKSAATTFGARLLRAVPLQKLKILVVVWQILTQFSHLADIPYPRSYQRFLNIVDIFNFDLSWLLTASCLVGNIDFYQRLLAITLGPLLALAFLGITFSTAMHVHQPDAGQESSPARQQAVVRHSSAALLVLFLIFSSVSTTVFSTYACDYVEDLGVSLLRADYRISCDDSDHLFYEVYAGVMILLYPIGIPVLFAVLLLNRRDKINPPLPTPPKSSPSLAAAISSSTAETERGSIDMGRTCSIDGPRRNNDGGVESAPEFGEKKAEDERGGTSSSLVGSCSGEGGGERRTGNGGGGHAPAATVGGAAMSSDEVLNTRLHDMDLQSTRFLWEPYEPDTYYYETVECGRRCLLTGVLVFVLPNTAGQAAGACVFAFISMLAFELLRPHLSHSDAWMYRTGCIVVFFSNFLALMGKADVSDESSRSQETFGLVLIAVHASMVVAVIVQSYFAMEVMSENPDQLLDSLWKGSTTKASNPRNSGMPSEGTAAGGGQKSTLSRSGSDRRPKLWQRIHPKPDLTRSGRTADRDEHA